MLISRLIFIYFCICLQEPKAENCFPRGRRGMGWGGGARGTDLSPSCSKDLRKIRGVITSCPAVLQGWQENPGTSPWGSSPGPGLAGLRVHGGPSPHRVTVEQGSGAHMWHGQCASPNSGLPSSRRQRGQVLKMKHTPQVQVKKVNWHIFQLGLECETTTSTFRRKDHLAVRQCSPSWPPHLGRDYLPREEDTLTARRSRSLGLIWTGGDTAGKGCGKGTRLGINLGSSHPNPVTSPALFPSVKWA